MSNPLQVEVVLSHSEHLPIVDVWLVIDILRASTMMTSWFAQGGAELYPADSIETAVRLAERLREEGKEPLLMGEQNAIAPLGFDLGNSPLDITRELVQERPCAVMATTNGTKAILKVASTGIPVFVACARNASAALDSALSKGNRIGLFCSGRKGRPAWDDTLCAGLLIARLMEHFPDTRLADSARLAHLTWLGSKDFEASLKSADHAIFLEKIGYGEDIVFAAEIDATRSVPELHELPDGKEMRAVLHPNTVEEKSLIWSSRPLPVRSDAVLGSVPSNAALGPASKVRESEISVSQQEKSLFSFLSSTSPAPSRTLLGGGDVLFSGMGDKRQHRNNSRKT
jgi:2-phosphosulfolactate phosphatase